MRISVVICTCNGEKYITEQVDSIVSQTFRPDEIIISDDKSDDDTVKKVYNVLVNSNIDYKIVENKQRLGCVKNFEHALSLVTGDIILLADQDDIWKLNKIEEILPYFQDENVWLVFHDAELVDGNLNIISKSWFLEIGLNVKKFNRGDYSDLLLKNYIQGAAMAFRAQLLEKALPFSIYSFHDEWLGLTTLFIRKKIVAVSKPLIKYRQWGGNTLGGDKKGTVFYLNKLLRRKKLREENRREILRRCDLFNDMCKMGQDIKFDYNFYKALIGANYRKKYICVEEKMPNILYYRFFFKKSKWWASYIKDLLSCF